MRTWLKELREKNGLSQTELARLVGVSRTIVQRWEAGDDMKDDNKAVLVSVFGPEVAIAFASELQARATGAVPATPAEGAA